MQKDLKFRAFKTAFDQARFSTAPRHRVPQFLAQRREAEAADSAQLDAVERRPPPLPRIQVRRRGRETRGREPLLGPIREALGEHAAARDRRASPDEPPRAWDRPQEMRQKGHDRGRVERPFRAVPIPLPRWGDGADGREGLAGPPRLANRRVASRRVGADHTGHGIAP